MKTITAPRIAAVTALVALAGAATLAITGLGHDAAAPVEKLERVVVVGKRATDEQQARVQLPRVVIIGQRATDGAQTASAMRFAKQV